MDRAQACRTHAERALAYADVLDLEYRNGSGGSILDQLHALRAVQGELGRDCSADIYGALAALASRLREHCQFRYEDDPVHVRASRGLILAEEALLLLVVRTPAEIAALVEDVAERRW